MTNRGVRHPDGVMTMEMGHQSSFARSRRSAWRAGADWSAGAILVVAAVVTSVPAVVSEVGGGGVFGMNDYSWHIEHGTSFTLWPFEPPAPHFLFHLMLRIVSILLPGGAATDTAAVIFGLRIATAFAIYAVLRNFINDGGTALRRNPALAATVLLLIVESPRILVDGNAITPGNAFLPLQTMFSATAQAALPLAVISPALLVAFVHRRSEHSLTRRRSWATVGVLVAGALAKPSLVNCILPVLPFWAFWLAAGSVRERLEVARSVVVRLCLPLVGVLVFQAVHLAYFIEPGRRGGIAWGPLKVGNAWGISHPSMWLAMILPLAGVAVAGLRWLRSPPVLLLTAGAVVGIAQFLLLTETGHRATDGNLGWGAQLCVYLLSILAVREVWARTSRSGWAINAPARRAQLTIAWAIVAITALSGVVSTVRQIGDIGDPASPTHIAATVTR